MLILLLGFRVVQRSLAEVPAEKYNVNVYSSRKSKMEHLTYK